MTRREAPQSQFPTATPTSQATPAARRSVSRSFGRVARAGLVGGATLVAMGAASACLDRPVAPAEPRTSNTFSERVSLTQIDKIDLLFMIDNSASMADKQAILADAVPDLVRRLVAPDCVAENPFNEASAQAQLAAGTITDLDKAVPLPLVRATPVQGVCPTGVSVNPADKAVSGPTPLPADVVAQGPKQVDTVVEFNAIRDIHIGVISSSIGGHGGTYCGAPTDNDRAHLLTRGPSSTVTTWDGNSGFFQWDPDATKNPPGYGKGDTFEQKQAQIDALVADFGSVVVGTGQNGCGYEASLESWYRFLVDPNPPANVSPPDKIGELAKVEGTDDDLLQQRAEFLRPDSLVAIISLSDENDCSTVDGVLPSAVKRFDGVSNVDADGWNLGDSKSFPLNYLMAQAAFQMRPGTTACATDPSAPECTDCYRDANGPGCEGGNKTLSIAEDNPTLRCWDQKRRFGVDMLYPVQRYVDGLREAQIFDLRTIQGDGTSPLVANPLYQDLPYQRYQKLKGDLDQGVIDQATFDAKVKRLGDAATRAPYPSRSTDAVFFAGIVGVPWQDIAVDPNDLTQGYKVATKVDWSLLRTTNGAPPADPFMREAIEPRSGTHPITGEKLSSTDANRINGREWDSGKTDLMYACKLPLKTPKDCAADTTNCDCGYASDEVTTPEQIAAAAAATHNPLCQKDDNAAFGQTQYWAKAYPGSRFMEVMNRFQAGSIVASICTPNVANPDAADFGYRPAVNAIIDRLKSQLTGRCTPRKLAANPDGTTPCLIVDAQFDSSLATSDPAAVAECKVCTDRPGRKQLDKNLDALLRRNPDVARFDCLCEVQQFTGDDLTACSSGSSSVGQGQDKQGWCYVDNSSQGAKDVSPLTKACPTHTTIRLATDTNKSTLFITCLGAALGSGTAEPVASGEDTPAP
jgi:hypothetical protein